MLVVRLLRDFLKLTEDEIAKYESVLTRFHNMETDITRDAQEFYQQQLLIRQLRRDDILKALAKELNQ